MEAARSGRCGICKQKADLVVDHRHARRTVRGMLCGTCNRALGLFADRTERLRRAADYLEGV